MPTAWPLFFRSRCFPHLHFTLSSQLLCETLSTTFVFLYLSLLRWLAQPSVAAVTILKRYLNDTLAPVAVASPKAWQRLGN